MYTSNELVIFTGKQIRRKWDTQKKRFMYSVLDILEFLTGTADPTTYWQRVKRRLKREGSKIAEKVKRVRMPTGEKTQITEAADTESVLRIIQSISAPHAEAVKLWMAKSGLRRIEEAEHPERAIERAMSSYLKQGHSEQWVSLRLKSIEARKRLVGEWGARGVHGAEAFRTLTDDILQAWSGMKASEYKEFKGLTTESLRDNMNNLELILNLLAETAATEISRVTAPRGFEQSRVVAHAGGEVAGIARRKLESRTQRSAVTKATFKKLQERRKLKLLKG
ncbi:MAG TPA: hypothetical protein VEA59_04920 [Patescibacteria group bacterium]|nr:hypothetical protein [Patescibacteria group bacterium]